MFTTAGITFCTASTAASRRTSGSDEAPKAFGARAARRPESKKGRTEFNFKFINLQQQPTGPRFCAQAGLRLIFVGEAARSRLIPAARAKRQRTGALQKLRVAQRSR